MLHTELLLPLDWLHTGHQTAEVVSGRKRKLKVTSISKLLDIYTYLKDEMKGGVWRGRAGGAGEEE